jgi:AraC-like DNA-binding protein
MTHKIFKSPALQNVNAHSTARGAQIPVPPAYRVSSLARSNNAQSKWRTEAMRSHRSPTFLWFTRGQGRITISGVTRGFGAHNLIFMPARTMYGFESIAQTYGSIVHLPDDATLSFPSEPLHLRFRDAVQQNEITGMIEALSREIAQDQPGKERALALHAGMMSVWLERQIHVMPDYDMTPDASRRLTAAFTALVEEEFHTSHSVTHYAAELGVTAAHLTRACNIACAKPASALLSERIHFEARRLLTETKSPVKTIATSLGFASPAYFTRAFHKHTGTAPSAFRKTAQM